MKVILVLLWVNISFANDNHLKFFTEVYQDITINKCKKLLPIFKKFGDKNIINTQLDENKSEYFKKIIGGKNKEKFDKMIELDEQNIESEAYYRSTEDCLLKTEVVIYKRSLEKFKVKIFGFIASYLNINERHKNAIERPQEKISYQEIEIECLDFQKNILRDASFMISERYKRCQQVLGISYQKLISKMCSGKYPLSCQYKETVQKN